MEAEARFQTLIEQAPVGICVIEGGNLRYINPGFARLVGFVGPDGLVGQVAFTEFVAPEDRERLAACLADLSQDAGERRHRYTGLRQDGSRFHAEVCLCLDQHAGQPALIAVLSDIGAVFHAETHLARQAFYDGLTGLPNRTLFLDRLNQAITLACREDNLFAFLFLDLDGFQTVNARDGHDIGDQVLTAVAGRLVGALRATDTLARLGGDEFGVIASGLTFGDDVIPIAEKLIASLHASLLVAGHSLQLGVSIGIALYPHHAGDADHIYRAAASALAHAKETHRGGFCFHTPETVAELESRCG